MISLVCHATIPCARQPQSDSKRSSAGPNAEWTARIFCTCCDVYDGLIKSRQNLGGSWNRTQRVGPRMSAAMRIDRFARYVRHLLLPRTAGKVPATIWAVGRLGP